MNNPNKYPDTKISITGGGILAYMNAYLTMKEAKKQGRKIKITIYEKNESIHGTTSMHLVPSLTPDEMLCVIPPINELEKAMTIMFNEPGGIRANIDDIDSSKATQNFIEQIKIYNTPKNAKLIKARRELLLELGKLSMDMWDETYQNADEEFKKIMQESNYNSCLEPSCPEKKLRNGYRIDLIFDIPNASDKAIAMRDRYQKIGFPSTDIMSPDQVLEMDSSLKYFVEKNSHKRGKVRKWNDDATALWRPGGCINAGIFLPKLHQYLTEQMGTYIDTNGKEKNCFNVKYGHEVKGVEIEGNQIVGLHFNNKAKENNRKYADNQYLFFPGEAVGTMNRLGFKQSADAGFAGTSLLLNVKVPDGMESEFVDLNNFMEVHKQGIVLAWQAKYDVTEKEIFLGVAGTKAFYGDIVPSKKEEFFQNRTLAQLNIINEIMPAIISLALGKDTEEQNLTEEDLRYLEDNKIANRWVHVRAVAYDEMPTVGFLSTNDGTQMANAKVITHAGSGGVSFAISLNKLLEKDKEKDSAKFLEIFKPDRVVLNSNN